MFRKFQKILLKESYVKSISCNNEMLPNSDNANLCKNISVSDNVVLSPELISQAPDKML